MICFNSKMHKYNNLQRKESKTMMQPVIPVLLVFSIILIQMVVAPSVDEIGGVLKTEVRKLLNQKDNMAKILEIFKTAKENTDKAKEKVMQYSKKNLSEDLKKLLDKIAATPDEVYDEMKPMLEEMKPMLEEVTQKAKKLDTKLESESLAYRMFAKPVWGIISGLGYMSIGAAGYTIEALGTLAQIFNNGAKEGVVGYHNGEMPEGKTKEVLETIDNGVGTFRGWGSKLGNRAEDGLKKGFRRFGSRKNTVQEPATEAEGVPDGEGIPKETKPTHDD